MIMAPSLMTRAVTLDDINQLVDLGAGHMFPGSIDGVRFTSRRGNCSFFDGWRHQLQRLFSHGSNTWWRVTVCISFFYHSSSFVDQPDRARSLSSDWVGDQPVTRSPRRSAQLPARAIEALALCDAPLPVRLSLPPCSSHARGEPVATVRALPACAARCFCRHAADSAHSPWPEPCTFLRLCVALLRSEGMHRRLQDPVSMREEEVHRTF